MIQTGIPAPQYRAIAPKLSQSHRERRRITPLYASHPIPFTLGLFHTIRKPPRERWQTSRACLFPQESLSTKRTFRSLLPKKTLPASRPRSSSTIPRTARKPTRKPARPQPTPPTLSQKLALSAASSGSSHASRYSPPISSTASTPPSPPTSRPSSRRPSTTSRSSAGSASDSPSAAWRSFCRWERPTPSSIPNGCFLLA